MTVRSPAHPSGASLVSIKILSFRIRTRRAMISFSVGLGRDADPYK